MAQPSWERYIRVVEDDPRLHRATRHIPVIVVTGMDTSNLDKDQFSCVLEKPIGPDELVEAVEKCLESWRRSRPGR